MRNTLIINGHQNTERTGTYPGTTILEILSWTTILELLSQKHYPRTMILEHLRAYPITTIAHRHTAQTLQLRGFVENVGVSLVCVSKRVLATWCGGDTQDYG